MISLIFLHCPLKLLHTCIAGEPKSDIFHWWLTKVFQMILMHILPLSFKILHTSYSLGTDLTNPHPFLQVQVLKEHSQLRSNTTSFLSLYFQDRYFVVKAFWLDDLWWYCFEDPSWFNLMKTERIWKIMTSLSTQIIKDFWEKLLLTCVLVHYQARFRFVLIRMVVPWLMPEFCVKPERLQSILVFIFLLSAASELYSRFESQKATTPCYKKCRFVGIISDVNILHQQSPIMP